MSTIRCPFPGMDPYLEHPALWPDVHNALIVALRDELAPQIAPKYYIGLERRAYLLKPDDIVFIGRPDIAVVASQPAFPGPTRIATGTPVVNVDVPMNDEVQETYLVVHEVKTGALVTLLELLSPANKLFEEGRTTYLNKRAQVFRTLTNLVKIDLLRAGAPMPIVGRPVASHYRILVRRGWQRPKSQLYPFNLTQPIPTFPLPLARGDEEPLVDLGAILHAVYTRARYDLRLDYSQPAVPPLTEEEAAWAAEVMRRESP